MQIYLSWIKLECLKWILFCFKKSLEKFLIHFSLRFQSSGVAFSKVLKLSDGFLVCKFFNIGYYSTVNQYLQIFGGLGSDLIFHTPTKKIARKSWNITKISLYYLEYSIHDNIAKFRDIYSENLAIFDKRDFSLLNSEFRNSIAKFLLFLEPGYFTIE
jgi:hypothetical protein